MFWPVPQSYYKTLPAAGQPGSFWENRGDRFHAGVDIYAPFGAEVLALAEGQVVRVEQFTSPQQVDYWNVTKAITIQHKFGVVRYAEMDDMLVKTGDYIRAGAVLGHVGRVLNPACVSAQSPLYIQKLVENNNPTMLHLELIKSFPFNLPNYLGGNIFTDNRPEILLDPGEVLG